MQEYFADAWFLIALVSRFDGHHVAARRLETFVAHHRVVTHDAVLSEVLTYFSGAGTHARQVAVDIVRRALRDFLVEPASRELFLLALDLYESRRDKQYSLVDCMSMELMKQRGITHVLTNDHHFRQEGFTVLSDAQ
ncbi:MAG TPA: PIN domain-containing protein [Thermoanaerobaculia bacterium]|jgi:predicted nucleic acid-binding protein|nr:PIN domain-containing protein [Thermoanaerobaculia bacterium]